MPRTAPHRPPRDNGARHVRPDLFAVADLAQRVAALIGEAGDQLDVAEVALLAGEASRIRQHLQRWRDVLRELVDAQSATAEPQEESDR